MANLEDALKDKRILIIDDLVDARSSLKKMMALLGANLIDTANDGRQATEMIAEHNYDIILSDYNLESGKDGQQILEEARFTNRLKASALYIMVTGENAIDMVMGALEYEPDNYITKPYTLSMLQERLSRILLIKNEFKAINAALDAKDFELALKLAKEHLKHKPKLVMPLTRIIGKLYMRQKNYSAAKDAYEHLLKQKSVAWARLGQAICLHHLGESHQALAIIEQALIKHPMYVQCYDWYATILLSLGKEAKAQQQLQKAVELSPKAVLRQMELGRVAYQNGDYVTAEHAYDQAIKLGRYSCYKNTESYLQFVSAAQKILAQRDELAGRKTHQLGDKSIRILEELKQNYGDQKDTMFDASLLESATNFTLERPEQALAALNQAEHFLKELATPDYNRQLQMAEAFVKTEQHVKAQTVINQIDTSKLPDALKQQLASLTAQINPKDISAHLNLLNSQGIELYSQQKYDDAIKLFDEAAAHKDASASILMNAIQTKISFMENHQLNVTYLKDCHQYFTRIGHIAETDSRHQRFTNLKTTFNKLWQKAGV